jgi:acetyl esterase/lipase
LLTLSQAGQSGPLHAGQQQRAWRAHPAGDAVPLPAGAVAMRDIAYGSDPKQVMDVYRPRAASHAPVIFMVHGGAWRFGDKTATSVVANKIARWLPKGFIFISIDYPMLPQQDALRQADDVARALAFAQAHATSWGGDPAKFIVMGHSAGAHLVALLSAAPAKAYRIGAKPWLGTVALDSAAMDVAGVMQRRHLPFYDSAFGSDPAQWRQASPIAMLTAGATPLLAVCSTQRRDHSCTAAADYVARATTLGVRASVSQQDLSHEQIDERLGLPGAYTDDVEAFLRTLDPAVAAALAR